MEGQLGMVVQTKSCLALRKMWFSSYFWTFSGLKQCVNYLRGISMLCRKTSHAQLVKQFCQDKATEVPKWFLPSFVIYPDRSEEDLQSLTTIQRLKAKANRKKDEREALKQFAHGMESKVWIAKSSSGAKGEDILISEDVTKIIEFVDSMSQAHVIQKYIENPLLLDGDRKFDIRVWVLLDHEFNIHVFKEGVLRTSSESYKIGDLTDTVSHLTNHCLQEELSQNYGKYEEGNEMFYDQFNRFLLSKYGINMEDKILPQIYSIVKDCIYMIAEKLEPTTCSAYHSFQLLGFDFMVDADFNVWLLEINGSPACAQKLLPILVDSIINVVVNRIYPPQETEKDYSFMFHTIHRS